MCLSDCSKCKYLDRHPHPHHSGDILCGLNPAYASAWKRLNSLDEYTLSCLPIDDCREFKIDPAFEEKAFALSLNFFEWQKLERETSNPTISNALKDTVIQLNISLTKEKWQEIANSTAIAAVRVALEAEGIEAKRDDWIHVDSSCIDALRSHAVRLIAYTENASTLKIRFNSDLVYQYTNVPRDIFLNLLDASSKGRFFHRHIKDIYSYRLI